MFSIWTLISVTIAYMLFLFAVATLGNRAKRLPNSVYSLALGIHCTSWAFFGTTTQAAQFGWPLIPTYLGIILVMLFGYKLLLRVNTICKQYNITSIAEFISVRFNHSNSIAVLITCICFIGVIPYIALQLDAITLALNLLIRGLDTWTTSISFYVTIGMAIFAIWFGARNMSLTERNSGLMLTIAAQSLVKLTALIIVGIFVVYGIFDGFVDLAQQSLTYEPTLKTIQQPFAVWIYLSHVLLGICAMFCLPRQFHINFVENRHEDEIHQARWLFPTYLIGMSIFILPIALAGMVFFGDAQNPLLAAQNTSAIYANYTTDSYVLALPIAAQNASIAIIAYIGGLAASSSMIIVATLALGNMVANSLITPLLFSLKASRVKRAISQGLTLGKPSNQLKLSAVQVLRIRQLTILVMLCIAYAYHLNISQTAPLAQTGFIALSLLSQTFPAILLGIYWRQANKFGALAGIVSGVLSIFVGMLWPALSTQTTDSQSIAFVLFSSFTVNISMLIIVSLLTTNKANNPYALSALNSLRSGINYSDIYFSDLLTLTDQILPSPAAQRFREQVVFVGVKQNEIAPYTVLRKAENLLASHMGSASTRILLSTIALSESVSKQQMSELVKEAGKNFQFNYEVLQASITHLPLGVSVIDANMKMVAWNSIYERLFDYPQDYLRVGKPILDILHFNANRGLLGSTDNQQNIQLEINKRMQSMLLGKSYKTVRQQLNNRVTEIAGNALPAGGYITCYTDITEYIHIQNQLETAKTSLEKRVEKRTQELRLAKNEAEKANIGKTKFLAATSHDLMQPLNAASLFASMLQDRIKRNLRVSSFGSAHSEALDDSQTNLMLNNQAELADNLVNSLDNAESLLATLVDITKLENNLIKPNLQRFPLNDLLSSLVVEFSILASQKQLEIVYVKTSIWLNTDRRLLSRVIQNLLSNAIKYTASGKILIGVKRKPNKRCEIVVADTGSGIALEDQQHIFTEFQRVHTDNTHPGLGLGLTIVDKISQLLNYQVSLRSIVNKGSRFGIALPTAKKQARETTTQIIEKNDETPLFLNTKTILVLENDSAVATALITLLSSWGAKVESRPNKEKALDLIKRAGFEPDLIIADYHLDDGNNGIDAALSVQTYLNKEINTVISSADRSETLQALAYEHNMQYLPKPIKQAALKRLLQKLLRKN
jgi:Na+/proline symporter/signal transduction histidine kinase